MPRLVRWYIRTALIYFILELIAGLLLAMRLFDIPGLRPVYFHLLNGTGTVGEGSTDQVFRGLKNL